MNHQYGIAKSWRFAVYASCLVMAPLLLWSGSRLLSQWERSGSWLALLLMTVPVGMVGLMGCGLLEMYRAKGHRQLFIRPILPADVPGGSGQKADGPGPVHLFLSPHPYSLGAAAGGTRSIGTGSGIPAGAGGEYRQRVRKARIAGSTLVFSCSPVKAMPLRVAFYGMLNKDETRSRQGRVWR
jgi:hypothetical protein